MNKLSPGGQPLQYSTVHVATRSYSYLVIPGHTSPPGHTCLGVDPRSYEYSTVPYLARFVTVAINFRPHLCRTCAEVLYTTGIHNWYTGYTGGPINAETRMDMPN